MAAVLAAAGVLAAATSARAQSNQPAQGPWGGKPLILLHGGLGAIEMFGPNLPALAKVRQVIGVDLQGHGRTADIDRPLSVELMADDIAALIKYLKLERPDIMGYSLGGGVALRRPFGIRTWQANWYFPKLLDKIGEAMKQDFDLSKEVAGIKATTLVVAGDADIFPPAHAVEVLRLLGG